MKHTILHSVRSSDIFNWGPGQQKAFDEPKEHIQKLLTLSSPHPDQPLILYVSPSHTVVSGALMQEKKQQRMIRKYLIKSQYTLPMKL
jgi:hypothetical protein